MYVHSLLAAAGWQVHQVQSQLKHCTMNISLQSAATQLILINCIAYTLDPGMPTILHVAYMQYAVKQPPPCLHGGQELVHCLLHKQDTSSSISSSAVH
jgi:hypothetical protein